MSILARKKSNVQHANQTNFDQLVLNADVPVLVDFYADWCGPCKMIAPLLEEVAQEATDARVVKVNVDDNPQLAARYGISSIPSLLVFKDGEVVGQQVGLVNKSQLKSMLQI
jgi:thioredoxin 1